METTKKEFKGTKGKDGKWGIEPFMHKSPEMHQEIIVRIESEHFKKVAIASVYDMNRDEGKANAQLIASAPKLLEALQVIIHDVADDSIRRLYPKEFKQAESATSSALGE